MNVSLSTLVHGRVRADAGFDVERSELPAVTHVN